MEAELIAFLIQHLGYAKLLRLIDAECRTFGVRIDWSSHATDQLSKR